MLPLLDCSLHWTYTESPSHAFYVSLTCLPLFHSLPKSVNKVPQTPLQEEEVEKRKGWNDLSITLLVQGTVNIEDCSV